MREKLCYGWMIACFQIRVLGSAKAAAAVQIDGENLYKLIPRTGFESSGKSKRGGRKKQSVEYFKMRKSQFSHGAKFLSTPLWWVNENIGFDCFPSKTIPSHLQFISTAVNKFYLNPYVGQISINSYFNNSLK